MTAETAYAVYEAFIMAEALSEEERFMVLAKFVHEGKVDSLCCNASKEDVIVELNKMFRVWTIERNKKGNIL